MAFYEERHDFDANYLFWGDGVDFTYPFHVHRCPEIFCVTEGSMAVTVEDKEYSVQEGDTVVIWSHQVHCFAAKGHCRHELCIFAPELVQRFFLTHAGEYPKSPVISAQSGSHIPHLVHLLKEEQSIYKTKGLLYLLCGEIEQHTEFLKRTRGKQESGAALLSQILAYVNENYQQDCSLDSIAEALSYEKTYLSKFFSRRIGITLAEYVLQVRLARASDLLLNSEANIIDVSTASGFNSPRTFNRNFAEQFGVTPSQYRLGKGGELRKKTGRWDKTAENAKVTDQK